MQVGFVDIPFKVANSLSDAVGFLHKNGFSELMKTSVGFDMYLTFAQDVIPPKAACATYLASGMHPDKKLFEEAIVELSRYPVYTLTAEPAPDAMIIQESWEHL